jgi:hypothetical protein
VESGNVFWVFRVNYLQQDNKYLFEKQGGEQEIKKKN